MDYYALERLIEESKKLDEETTSANIAFIPGGFSPVKKKLKRMGKKKKKWKLQYLECQDRYKLNFEDFLMVEVKKENWEEFKSEFLDGNVIFENGMTIDLTPYYKEASLDEAMKETMGKLRSDLQKAFLNTLNSDPVKWIVEDTLLWKKKFRVLQQDVPKNTVIDMRMIGNSIAKAVRNIYRYYKEDRGNIEMIIDALNEQLPLNSFEAFQDYDNLAGTTIRTREGDISVVFSATVSISFVPSEQVYVLDKEILEEFKNDPTVQVADNKIFPRGKRFDRAFFDKLEDAIDKSLGYGLDKEEGEDEQISSRSEEVDNI